MTQKRASFFAALFCVVIGLSSCNTTDALTPQVDIPNGGTVSSKPVTQADLDRMVNAPLPPASVSSPVPSAPDPLNPPPDQTLQAQANRLNNQGQLVAPQQPMPPVQQQQTAQQPQQPQQLQPQNASAGSSIRFLPIIGAPVGAVTPLSRQLGNEAKARGLTIKGTNDPGTEHILKGYLNAFTDGNKTTVIYVWDILDSAGGRLHRLQGQGSIPAVAADPWSVVPASMMEQIATRTMNDYMTWRQTQ